MRALVRLPYPAVCTLLGLALGWLPRFVHGPIPEKFDLYYLRGAVIVWGWYTARLLIGFLVGITHWPYRWWLRGPLCGMILILPLGFVSLGTPTCGPVCMCWNMTTGALVGLLVGAIAWLVTRRSAGCEGPAR